MSTVDLRQIGSITAEDEFYLAQLIAYTCTKDDIKHFLSLHAKHDFEWINGCLMNYVLADLMTLNSSRINDCISSSEFLCGIFNSGPCLSIEHLRLMMTFINPNVLFEGPYISGKTYWNNVSPVLKTILNILDDAILNNQLVFVVSPTVIPIDPNDRLEELEKLPFDILKDKIRIEWD
jgi:hypothetical protein